MLWLDTNFKSLTTPTHEISFDSDIRISPNPTSDFLNIHLEDQIEIEQILIFESGGRLIHKSNSNANISVGRLLKDGIYYIKIISREGKVYLGKIVLTK